MATIFLSYRRTDGAQASRMHDWLTSRFGEDAVFMDVDDIPFAVSFTDFIKEAIENSRVLLALIGPEWTEKMAEETDPVRRELEWALSSEIPVLPVLIGTTPMPSPEQLPDTLSHLSYQNALTVDILQGFHAHMRALLVKVERILGELALTTAATSSPTVIRDVCAGVMEFLRMKAAESEFVPENFDFSVISPYHLEHDRANPGLAGVTLLLHRASRVAELLDLHFLLSFWAASSSPSPADDENVLAGWTLHQIERTPVIAREFFPAEAIPECEVRVRSSDEDSREIWRMLTDLPLRLSHGYIATVAPIQTVRSDQ